MRVSGDVCTECDVPGGSLAKAPSVGAKTVKGPGLFKVSTRFAALTAVTKVEKPSAETAISTISGMAGILWL
jgi:hypothetical protein